MCCSNVLLSVPLLCLQNGRNALHHAAYCGHIEMVRYLISLLGEKKFEVDRDGNSCLTLAILNQKDDMIAYLIYEGGFNTEQ